MSVLLIIVLTILLAWFLVPKCKIFLAGIRIPGPFAFPLLGNIQIALQLKPSYVFLVFTKLREKYRRTYRLWLGPQLWVFLHTPQETRDALNDPTLRKPDTFLQLSVLIGNGLLISHGKYWENQRKALGPAFHPSLLNTFTPRILSHCDTLVTKLKSLNGATIEVSDYIFPCILDAIIDTSMGKVINAQNDPHSKYTHTFHKTSELLFKRMMNPLLAPDFIFKLTNIWKELEHHLNTINALMNGVIKERSDILAELDASSESVADGSQENNEMRTKRRKTLLDILLTSRTNGRLLTCREIRNEVNTFVFAGVDTTTAAMSFVLYALAKYPDEQERVFNEILSLDLEDDANSQTLNQLEYLDMFIKECLRLYTIVPATGRQTTTFTRIGNVLYPPGITLWINMYGLAHDSDYFPEPYTFKPQRFEKDQDRAIPPFCYIPFSGGHHNCIGKRYSLLIMKLMVIKILKEFELELENPEEELVLIAQMVLKSKDGINIIFKERQSQN